MIISEKYKYCFIEYPRSASYAIQKELLELYEGEEWLDKHSTCLDFIKSRPKDHNEFFIFCSTRNPLEDLISVYNINRTNNSGRAEAEFWKDYKWYIRMRELRRAKYFQNNSNPSFHDFFIKMFRTPYIRPRIIADFLTGRIDHIIRLETIQDDFNYALGKVGLKPKREISRVNVSTREPIDLDQMYPIKVRNHAFKILGPSMNFMRYEFPNSWSPAKIPASSSLIFNCAKPIIKRFWKYVPYG